MLSKIETMEIWTGVNTDDEKRETFSLEQRKQVSETLGIKEEKWEVLLFPRKMYNIIQIKIVS